MRHTNPTALSFLLFLIFLDLVRTFVTYLLVHFYTLLSDPFRFLPSLSPHLIILDNISFIYLSTSSLLLGSTFH